MHADDSLRRELLQMQQSYKDAVARAADLQRKNNLLKDEVTRYRKVLGDTTNLSIRSENEEAKELSAGPSCCDPLAELEMENKVLRDRNAKHEALLRTRK